MVIYMQGKRIIIIIIVIIIIVVVVVVVGFLKYDNIELSIRR